MAQPLEIEIRKKQEKLRRINAAKRIQRCDVPFDDIEALIELETTANAFSCFYRFDPNNNNAKNQKPDVFSIHYDFSKYEHSDAVEFAATSWRWNAELLKKPGHLEQKTVDVKSFPTTSEATGLRAYYRVIDQNEQNYILMACHVNVHGFHRGDLRFVEVNQCTVAEGFEEHSVIGHLFLGDIVAVKKLRRTSSESLNPPHVFTVHPSKKCVWEVEKMAVLKRSLKDNVVFGFLENGTAIAAGHDEPMNVKVERKHETTQDKLFSGSTFTPAKLKFNTIGRDETRRNEWLVQQSSKVPTYPSPFGTIYDYRLSETETERFEIGTQAFRKVSDSEEQEEIVERCGIMGYTATNSVLNGRFDWRQFALKDVTRNGSILSFSIPNPITEPTEGRWKSSNRVIVQGKRFSNQGDTHWLKLNGVVETVQLAPKRRLQISLRLARNSPKDVNFSAGIFLVSQRENYESSPLRKMFFKTLDEESNGRRIITTLYGGNAIDKAADLPRGAISFPSTPPVQLNQFQEEYVNMLLAKTPMVLGSSPFGCGKSMSIVTTSIEVWKQHKASKAKFEPHWQLLVTQSNFASVNLVDITLKCEESLKKTGVTPRFLRYVSLSNWRELPDNCRTVYDLPELTRDVFTQWARGEIYFAFDDGEAESVTLYVLDSGYVEPSELRGAAWNVYCTTVKHWIKKEEKNKMKREPWLPLKEFLRLYQPQIVISTADSIRGLLGADELSRELVSHIQIDEASQLPEYMLINLLAKFPNACFGMIGDIHQLPPYCEDELTGKLKEFGIGNTMERALKNNMFPRADLKIVYRCHPETTSLLSDLFYGGQLIAGVTADMRNEFMRRRPDLWPNANFPIAIINNEGPTTPMGKSCGNKAEKQIVKQLVDELLREHNGYRLKPEDVGVISFYAAQTSELIVELRPLGVKCGTVDAFQGNEREVMVLCCTNETLTDFMQVSNRINVAMSRARQATFVIGNVEGLSRAQYWSTIVEEVKMEGCLLDTTKYPFTSSFVIDVFHVDVPKKDDKNKKASAKQKKKLEEVMSKITISDAPAKGDGNQKVAKKTPAQIRKARRLRSKAAKKKAEADEFTI